MAGDITQAGDLFIPQAVGATATDILFAKLNMITSGAVLAGNPGEIWAQDRGENITFPYFNTTLTNMVKDAVRDSRTGVDAEKLSMGNYPELVENKTISVDADGFSFTDAGPELGQHLAQVIADRVGYTMQKSLVRKAMQTDLQYSLLGEATKTMTVDGILEARMAWGDYASDVPSAILFMHSKQYKDLAKTADFKTLGSAATNAVVQVGDGAAASPIAAVVHGVGIVLLDSVQHSRGLTIASLTRTGTVATLTTTGDHGILAGDIITISGATPDNFNGAYTVDTVPTSTTLTYAVANSGATTATGTIVFVPNYHALLCAPASLGLAIKKQPATDLVPHAGSVVKTFDTHFRFATTLFRRRPRPVVRLVTQ